MDNKLIGYKIRGDYYLKSDVSFGDNLRACGDEVCIVWVKKGSTEAVLYTVPGEVKKIYKKDNESIEIFKLQVEQLTEKVEKLDSTLSEQDIEIHKYDYELLLDSIQRNSQEIVNLRSKHRVGKYSQQLISGEIESAEERVKADYTNLFDKLLENISSNIRKQGLFNIVIATIVIVILVFQ